jgi:mRNA-degrading endonuclease YafQ of YafQ-DinJ toxin-antitoxin module
VVENFWEKFYDLLPEQKESVRRAWLIFKQNPFDARLKTHSIHRLSARYKTTIYSVVIENDLRVIFRIDGGTVTTLDVGSHDLYR